MGKNKESAKPGKKANISRIPPLIFLRLSKKFLEKYNIIKAKVLQSMPPGYSMD